MILILKCQHCTRLEAHCTTLRHESWWVQEPEAGTGVMWLETWNSYFRKTFIVSHWHTEPCVYGQQLKLVPINKSKSNITHWTLKNTLYLQLRELNSQTKRVREHAMSQSKPFLFQYLYLSCHYNTTMIVSATTSNRSVLGKLGHGAVYWHLPSALLVPTGKTMASEWTHQVRVHHQCVGWSERGSWPQNKDQRWKNRIEK